MRTFVQQQTQQQSQSHRQEYSHLSRTNKAISEPKYRSSSIPTLKKFVEDGAFQNSTHTAYDFSKIQIYPASPPTALSKLAINYPDDCFEQEADRVSEKIIRMPEPQSKIACSNGRGCPRCLTGQLDRERESLQLKSAQASSSGKIAAPVIVHEALRSPGQSLDPLTRVFMEQRFSHDFGQVRIHADAKAAESARAIDALAYTVANDIVFDAGQYLPHTTGGRTLLAHELTHIIQQGQGNMIHRRPKPQSIKARKHDAWLKELGDQPDEAHREWKHLTNLDKVAVIVEMTKRYGADFAKSFLHFVDHPIKTIYQHYGPRFPEHTPEWFEARGYKLWQRSSVNEFWVHPSGNVIMQIRDQAQASTPSKPEPPEGDCTEMERIVLSILSDTVSTETAAKEDLEGEKGRLERADKTTKNYSQQYDQYTQSLKTMADRLKGTSDDIETLREQLVEMKCSTAMSTIDSQLQDLSDLQIWVDIESSDMSLQFLKPIKMRGPMDYTD